MNLRSLGLFCLLVFVPTSFLASCGREVTCERCLSSVFAGFTLADNYPATEKSGTGSTRPQPFPQSFVPGKVYVFEPNTPMTTERASIVTLPSRLRECGAKTIEAPHTLNDLAPSSLGGPVWEIRFVLAHCRGRITNRLNPALRESRRDWPAGSFDDYVLELSRSR